MWQECQRDILADKEEYHLHATRLTNEQYFDYEETLLLTVDRQLGTFQMHFSILPSRRLSSDLRRKSFNLQIDSKQIQQTSSNR